MNAKELVDRVNRRCPELDPMRAHDVTVITMRTLAEHLAASDAENIAAVLPAVFAEAFDAARREKRAEPIEVALSDFEDQLVVRAEVDAKTADDVARSVARILRMALIEENADTSLLLPPELDELLEDNGHPYAAKSQRIADHY